MMDQRPLILAGVFSAIFCTCLYGCSAKAATLHHTRPAIAVDSRPHAWCGWFARFNFLAHDPGRAFNLAANWRRIGAMDPAPHRGDIVVWPHHVGKIVGECHGFFCPVWSGNDSHRERTRNRSVAGAVYRIPT